MTDASTPKAFGGTKAKTVPYSKALRYDGAELNELKSALEQGTLFYAHGKKVNEFEHAFARMQGASHAVAASSGTAAIHAALIALGISPGDEVITSPITDMGSVIPVLFQGAAPVFADVDVRTGTLDPGSVERCIGSKTRAVIAVHLAGNACDLDALSAMCRDAGVALIEDCAQAFGCTYKGRPVGTTGIVGCFSLNEFKHISCGDGGMCVTNDAALAHRLRLATDKGYDRGAGARMRHPAFLANNYRMSELQGAVGLAQLRKLDDIVARRRRWCTALTAALQGIDGVHLPRPTPGCEASWWFYLMRVDPALGVDADAFANALECEGLPVAAHYIGECVYAYPLFQQHTAFARGGHAYERYAYAKGICPNAEALLAACVTLSVNEGYSEQDLDETATAIRKVAAWFREKQ